ncbi:hypothetical protein ColKHC_08333 [Colletotrichum higginsianum]|nr:hypothetical protein ColKHC_08333 [Colletotrichum higginsianum]
MADTKENDNRNSDNSLEKELDYEDITIQAGESSKLRRKKNKDQKVKEEEKKQAQMKEAMFQAGESSRTRRRR